MYHPRNPLRAFTPAGMFGANAMGRDYLQEGWQRLHGTDSLFGGGFNPSSKGKMSSSSLPFETHNPILSFALGPYADSYLKYNGHKIKWPV